MANTQMNLKGTLGSYPSLLINNKQIANQKYELLKIRQKQIIKDHVELDKEFKDNAVQISKYESKEEDN